MNPMELELKFAQVHRDSHADEGKQTDRHSLFPPVEIRHVINFEHITLYFIHITIIKKKLSFKE